MYCFSLSGGLLCVFYIILFPMAEFPRGVVKSSLIAQGFNLSKSYKCYFFLHMDMFQDEVSVFGSKIATLRGKTDTSVGDIPICPFFNV